MTEGDGGLRGWWPRVMVASGNGWPVVMTVSCDVGQW